MSYSVRRTIMTILVIFSAGTAVMAMTVQSNSIEPVKSDTGDYFIELELSRWALSDDTILWIDSREGWNAEQIYGTQLNNPSHTEFLIDPNADQAAEIDMDYPMAAYSCTNTQGNYILRLADVTTTASPILYDVAIPGDWINEISISGNIVSYIAEGEGSGIFVTEIDNPNAPVTHYIAETDVVGSYLNDTALDGNILAWCGEGYDDLEGRYFGFLTVADITEPNNAVLSTAILPYDGADIWSANQFWNIDISEDWLVANGTFNGVSGIFAIRNFTDPNALSWEVLTLWQGCGGSEGCGPIAGEPRIDKPFVVWNLFGDGGGPYLMANPDAAAIAIDTSRDQLMGALLLEQGEAVTSLLRTAVTDETFSAIDVSGMNTIWSRYIFDYSYEEEYLDYMMGILELQCGDWGFMRGDVNQDCDVNLIDFAIITANWLNCTTPDDPGCQTGEIFIDFLCQM